MIWRKAERRTEETGRNGYNERCMGDNEKTTITCNDDGDHDDDDDEVVQLRSK